jgi:hypothetical protein
VQGATCQASVIYTDTIPFPAGILDATLEVSYNNGTADDLAIRLFLVNDI